MGQVKSENYKTGVRIDVDVVEASPSDVIVVRNPDGTTRQVRGVKIELI